MTLRTLNYGNYGIFLVMGNAGFCPSAVVSTPRVLERSSSRSDPRGDQVEDQPWEIPGTCVIEARLQ